MKNNDAVKKAMRAGTRDMDLFLTDGSIVTGKLFMNTMDFILVTQPYGNATVYKRDVRHVEYV